MFTKCSSPITSSRDATCAARVNPSLVFNVLCTLFYLGQMLRVGPLQRTFSEQCNQKKKAKAHISKQMHPFAPKQVVSVVISAR